MMYLTEDEVIEYNVLALHLIKAKKADKAGVLSHEKLRAALHECEETTGDVYDKAAVLLQAIVQKHPFASGNRRTAFVAAKEFLLKNNAPLRIHDDPAHASVMIGIREGFYTHAEIKEWIQHGTIQPFKR